MSIIFWNFYRINFVCHGGGSWLSFIVSYLSLFCSFNAVSCIRTASSCCGISFGVWSCWLPMWKWVKTFELWAAFLCSCPCYSQLFHYIEIISLIFSSIKPLLNCVLVSTAWSMSPLIERSNGLTSWYYQPQHEVLWDWFLDYLIFKCKRPISYHFHQYLSSCLEFLIII